MDRRRFLASLAAVGAAGTAGCLGGLNPLDGGGNEGNGTAETDEPGKATTAPTTTKTPAPTTPVPAVTDVPYGDIADLSPEVTGRVERPLTARRTVYRRVGENLTRRPEAGRVYFLARVAMTVEFGTDGERRLPAADRFEAIADGEAVAPTPVPSSVLGLRHPVRGGRGSGGDCRRRSRNDVRWTGSVATPEPTPTPTENGPPVDS
ncbi:hypothetical protein BRD17_00585 [Halobacteriales archaeon SW_7_68_16]|nr:MAG: hypothetical protein BRD17_00585 [Halobacteriales archaeon SW_7_68_16]